MKELVLKLVIESQKRRKLYFKKWNRLSDESFKIWNEIKEKGGFGYREYGICYNPDYANLYGYSDIANLKSEYKRIRKEIKRIGELIKIEGVYTGLLTPPLFLNDPFPPAPYDMKPN